MVVLELRFERFVSAEMEFDDSTKLAIILSTLEDLTELGPFIPWVEVMKENNQTWRRVSPLFIEGEDN